MSKLLDEVLNTFRVHHYAMKGEGYSAFSNTEKT